MIVYGLRWPIERSSHDPEADAFFTVLGHLVAEALADEAPLSLPTSTDPVVATGTTPHQWLQRQRVQLAQRLLEVSDLTIEMVAERSGFGTAGNLRKHFHRTVRTSPQAYRRAFQDRRSA